MIIRPQSGSSSSAPKGGDSLKFLVLMRPLGIPQMPSEESIKLVLATLDYWEQYLKSGKAVGGNLANNQGGGGIIEVESLEELHSILAEPRMPELSNTKFMD